jgi:hypothetical protein
LSSQTTGANEYFSKTISLKSALFFFVAMFLLYFILFLSVKSAFPLHLLWKKHGPSEKLQQICLHTGRMTNRCRFIEGVLSRSGRLFHNPRRRLRKHYTASALPANRWGVMPTTDAEGPALSLRNGGKRRALRSSHRVDGRAAWSARHFHHGECALAAAH